MIVPYVTYIFPLHIVGFMETAGIEPARCSLREPQSSRQHRQRSMPAGAADSSQWTRGVRRCQSLCGCHVAARNRAMLLSGWEEARKEIPSRREGSR